MENTKYLIWKLNFPRVGDTFVTVDKLMDMCSWEMLYSILKRITIQYAVTSQLTSSALSVQCCEFWYKLTIQKIPTDIQCVHKLFDTDSTLLHDEMLCANLLFDDSRENSTIIGEPSTSSATSSSNRRRTFSATFVQDGKADDNRTREKKVMRPPTPIRPLVSTNMKHKSLPANKIARSLSIEPSVSSVRLADTLNRKRRFSQHSKNGAGDDRKRERQVIKSFSPIRQLVSVNVTNESITENEMTQETQDIQSHLDDDMFLHLSDDEESESECDDQNSRRSCSDVSHSYSEPFNPLNDINGLKIKMDLQKLSECLKDPQYLNGFCFEKDGPNDAGNRTFNVYSVDNKISYAAFHSPHILKDIPNRSDCRLFFYYSEEMLHQLHSFTEMQFEGISNVLIVYINHFLDRVKPFGYILLPNKSLAMIDNVMKAIDGWLNADGLVSTVTKCITQQDEVLHHSIAGTWPQAKVIGCSAEYQNDIHRFAKKNKGFTPVHTELTRFAYFLCYLPEVYISQGIEMIQRHSSSEYGQNLVQYLQTKWAGRSISIYDEDIVYRSVIVCKQFNNQMIRKEFRDNTYRKGSILKNCWDFIEFLKISSKINWVEMGLDGTKFARSKLNFKLNTKRQIEKENCIVDIRKKFEINLVTMSQVDDAIKQFMQEMVLYV